jgi:hypothetical protein
MVILGSPAAGAAIRLRYPHDRGPVLVMFSHMQRYVVATLS